MNAQNAMANIKDVLSRYPDNGIYITSRDARELYQGKRTALAIKRRLTLERCGGERDVRAILITGLTSDGRSLGLIHNHSIDLESGKTEKMS